MVRKESGAAIDHPQQPQKKKGIEQHQRKGRKKDSGSFDGASGAEEEQKASAGQHSYQENYWRAKAKW